MDITFDSAKHHLMNADVIIASDMNMNIRFLMPEREISSSSENIYLIDAMSSNTNEPMYVIIEEKNPMVHTTKDGALMVQVEDGKLWFLDICMKIRVNL